MRKDNKRNFETNNNEFKLDKNSELVSTTDLRGVITYCNDEFIKASGYSEEELTGKNHNLVRHPDMPKEAFADLWSNLKSGEHWRGIVKNRRKNGGFYWVDAFVTPIFKNGEIVGYQSVRRMASDKDISTASAAYKRINEGKSLTSKFDNKKMRFLTFAIGAVGLCMASIMVNPLFSIPATLLAPLMFRYEIIYLSKYIQNIKSDYDSVSRHIYSGSDDVSIIDFKSKMYDGQIKTIIGRVIDSNKTLNIGASKLSESATRAQQGIEEETSQVHQISTAIEEMTSTISEVAQNTVTASKQVEEAHSDCEKTIDSMQKTMNEISSLSEEVKSSSMSATQLSENAKQVGEVVLEIQKIADQTNLLALNAAIEAARAGENGRGFSVVADEVRKLSSNTHDVTEQIKETVNSMQLSLTELADKMDKGNSSAESCIEQAKSSENRLNSIYESITQISDLTMQISTASEQQSMVSASISENINTISDISKTNLEQANIVQDEAKIILGRSEGLKDLAKTFS